MKINNAFLIIALCGLLTACGGGSSTSAPAAAKPDSAATMATFDKTYTGLLGADSVLMHLQAKEHIISGAYFIKGQESEVVLNGSAYGQDSVRLEGLDAANQTATQFLGTIKGTVFSGKWGNNTFSLAETALPYGAALYMRNDTLAYKTVKQNKKYAAIKCNCLCEYAVVENPEKKPAIDKINADIKKNFEDVMDDCKDYEPYEGQTEAYENEAVGHVVFNNGQIFGIELAGYYTGGAHPNHWVNTYYYDVATGQRIKLVDLFQGPNLKKLAELAQGKLKKAYKAKSLQAAGFFENSITLKGDENFYVQYKNDSAFVLLFNPYEIAPYVMGDIEVEMKYSEIKPLISNRTAFSKVIK